MKKMPTSAQNVALVTYTYNDQKYVEGLLNSLAGWTVCPSQIVVVDDGSDQPYVNNSFPHLKVEIIRLQENCGITKAKQTGISFPQKEFIFSIDCDVRTSPEYLEKCIYHLNKNKIGMVSGSTIYSSGNDLVSRYLSYFGDNHNVYSNGPVNFIPGNAYLLKRSCWEEVRGLEKFNRSVCEDHELSKRLRNAGYTLFADNAAKAWQVRSLARHVSCMRVWKWCHLACKRQMPKVTEHLPTYFFKSLVEPMLNRIECSIRFKEPIFIYIELLYMLLTIGDMIDYAKKQKLLTNDDEAAFFSTILNPMSKYPRSISILKDDYQKITQATGNRLIWLTQNESLVRISEWKSFKVVMDIIDKTGFFTWFEKKGIFEMLADDSKADYGFSSYAKSKYSTNIA